MRIAEATCGACGETFVPAGEDDLIHGVREDGTECGGTGTITTVWVMEHPVTHSAEPAGTSDEPVRVPSVTRCIDCFAAVHQDADGEWVCDATGDEHRPNLHVTQAHLRAVKRITEALDEHDVDRDGDEEFATDLLTDVMHYLAAHGVNPSDAFASADRHFDAEWANPDDLADAYTRD